MSKFVELYGNPIGYQTGRPIHPISYGITQNIADDLRKFKKVENFLCNVKLSMVKFFILLDTEL